MADRPNEYDGEPEIIPTTTMEQMARWLNSQPWSNKDGNYPSNLLTGLGRAMTDLSALEKMKGFVAGGYTFFHYNHVETSLTQQICAYDKDGLTIQTGAYEFHFENKENHTEFSVLAIGVPYRDNEKHNWEYNYAFMANVPEYFVKGWMAFSSECERISVAVEPDQKVYVIGGKIESFIPTVSWDDIILPTDLKSKIQADVQNFFTKGVQIYLDRNLKPFRKFLFAGPPGTGKTMICTAIAKKALEDGYIVIYLSSASKGPGDRYGSTFDKIEYALQVAAGSEYPCVIILEEIDAYLHEEEKALILNVLDGNESPLSKYGTLLIATTNYPEVIDDRIMKRPGRLDRIYVIPEVKVEEDVELLLRKYIGNMWQEEHAGLVPLLMGYPGAFIREVSIAAVTQCVSDDLTVLSYEMLEKAFYDLKDQIDARDSFLSGKPEFKQFGDAPSARNGQFKIAREVPLIGGPKPWPGEGKPIRRSKND
jgi:hypothetical protein